MLGRATYRGPQLPPECEVAKWTSDAEEDTIRQPTIEPSTHKHVENMRIDNVRGASARQFPPLNTEKMGGSLKEVGNHPGMQPRGPCFHEFRA